MKRLALLWVLFAVAGCTVDGGGPEGPGALGPVAGVPVGVVSDFSLSPLAAPAMRPVVAVGSNGAIHAAYIDGADQWPVLLQAGFDPTPLPGTIQPTLALSMLASQDGALHIVWDPGTAIHYVRVEASGFFHEPMVIVAEGAREPTIAMSQAGDVYVAYTEDSPAVEQADRIMVARGQLQGTFAGFLPPEHVNADCCVDDIGNAAQVMSGPSMAIGDDGSVHVVYEWTGSFNTRIEYQHDRSGQFSAPLTISDVAFSPCPAIAVDGNTTHITYIREYDRNIWHTTISNGELAQPTPIYEATDYPTMALMLLAPDGELHVGVTESRADGGHLSYIRVGAAPGALPVNVTQSEMASGFLDLTPATGGAVITPSGDVAFAYERVLRQGDMGQAEYAISK